MTPAELKDLLTTVVTDLNAVGDMAAGVDPALVPFIAIGKGIAKQIPGIAEIVDSWIQGNPPTTQEIADNAAKLAVLGNPNLP